MDEGNKAADVVSTEKPEDFSEAFTILSEKLDDCFELHSHIQHLGDTVKAMFAKQTELARERREKGIEQAEFEALDRQQKELQTLAECFDAEIKESLMMGENMESLFRNSAGLYHELAASKLCKTGKMVSELQSILGIDKPRR